MKPNWTGVCPAVTTNFFAYNIAQQIEAGVHGIVVGGSLGENSMLTFDEKLQLLATAKQTAAQHVPIIMGVAIYELIKQGRVAEALPIYRWFFPLLHLDISTKFVQNIKLAKVATGLGTEFLREQRARVLQIINDAIATRPVLPVF